MAHRVFYSFHYKPDNWRASQVRNMGVIDGNRPCSDNDWETITKGGDDKIKKWIDDQLNGRSCTVVLIGRDTAKRKWIDYEIRTSWNNSKGVVGIYIHNLKDLGKNQTTKGANPFAHITMKRDGKSLSSIVKAHNPPYMDSTQVYNYINKNLRDWIEEAITIRAGY